jgi:hypothetical protein
MRPITRVNYYQEYMDNGTWKCEPSPTGAHKWDVKVGEMTCYYCKVVRIIERTPASMPFSNYYQTNKRKTEKVVKKKSRLY